MEQQIIAGLVARGMPPHIAVGVVANMKAESGLQPGINEIAPVVPGSRGGFGLNQWTGPRRVAFERFAQERGVSPDDVNAQLDFTMMELQGPESAAWGRLQGASDPMEAARIYSESFLRPGIPNMDKRLAYAAELAGMPLSMGTPPQTPQNGPQNALAAFQPTEMRQDPRAFMRAPNALAEAPLMAAPMQNNLRRLMG